MENNSKFNPEELKKMLGKAKEELDKMSPEDREKAVNEAKKLAGDNAALQNVIDGAAKFVTGGFPKGK